jgi:hypothetical protein
MLTEEFNLQGSQTDVNRLRKLFRPPPNPFVHSYLIFDVVALRNLAIAFSQIRSSI